MLDEIKKELLESRPLDMEGFWDISSHTLISVSGDYHFYSLAIVQGKYKDVVEYAFNLEEFFNGKECGAISPVEIIKL